MQGYAGIIGHGGVWILLLVYGAFNFISASFCFGRKSKLKIYLKVLVNVFYSIRLRNQEKIRGFSS